MKLCFINCRKQQYFVLSRLFSLNCKDLYFLHVYFELKIHNKNIQIHTNKDFSKVNEFTHLYEL